MTSPVRLSSLHWSQLGVAMAMAMALALGWHCMAPVGTAAAAEPSAPPVPSLESFEPGVRQALTESLAEFRTAVAADPADTGAAWGELGMTYQAHHLQSLARQCYVEAVERQPQVFRWRYLLAYLYQETGEFDAALESYEIALQLDPAYLPALLRRAQVQLKQRRLEDAEAGFVAVLESRPGQPAALAGLAQVALERGEYPRAVVLFEQALAADPGADRLRYPLAMAYRQQGQVEQAQRNLAMKGDTDAAVADPILADMAGRSRSAQYYLERGYAASRAGRPQDAVTEFRRAVEYNPDDAAARVSLGQGLQQIGQSGAALAQFERALEIDPGFGPARYRRGAIREERGDEAGAIEDYQAALSVDPGDSLASLRLGHALMRAGRYREAEAVYAAAVPPPEQLAIFAYRSGLAALAAGDCATAWSEFERSLEAQAGSGEVMQALARSYAGCPGASAERLRLALEHANAIFQARPDYAHAETLAMALAANGRWQQAIQLQTRLVEASAAGEEQQRRWARQLLEAYREQQQAASAWPPGHQVFRPAAIGAGRDAPGDR